MPFLTPEEVLKVRMKGSKPLVIAELAEFGKELRAVKMSTNAVSAVEKLHQEIAAGTKPAAESLRILLSVGCSDATGRLLGEETAGQLLESVSFETVSTICKEITLLNGGDLPDAVKKPEGEAVGNSAGSPSAA